MKNFTDMIRKEVLQSSFSRLKIVSDHEVNMGEYQRCLCDRNGYLMYLHLLEIAICSVGLLIIFSSSWIQ